MARHLFVLRMKQVVCFIHSFIQAIYIAPLKSATTQKCSRLYQCTDTVPEKRSQHITDTPKRHRQMPVKDLPKIPTWWQERDSNPHPPEGFDSTNAPPGPPRDVV